MTDQNNPPGPTPDEQERQAFEVYSRAINTVIEQGREDFGDEGFDTMSKEVADAVGVQAIPAVMTSIVQCDAPARIIEHLSEQPQLAKKLASMTPARRAAELGRIEARLMPDGAGSGDEPAWMARAKGGEKRGLGDDLDDRTWERNFKKKYPGGFNPYER